MAVEFMVNHVWVVAKEPAGMLVLDWLRVHRQLVGTKEGCKEGDCGACSVMVGVLKGDRMCYTSATSCLMPLGELHGKHLLTIEGLNLPQGQLNPVQEAMVHQGGSQCGFCTPGFIVSMCWYIMQSIDKTPHLEGLKHAISGNLCRCTGYGSIFRACEDLVARFASGGDLEYIWMSEDRVTALAVKGFLPDYLTTVAQNLADFDDQTHAGAHTKDDVSNDVSNDVSKLLIAGGTDLYVQRGEEIPLLEVNALGRQDKLAYIDIQEHVVHVGALTSFEAFASHAQIQAMLPTIKSDMALIASLPIRNRATIVGNLINASPIGDMTALMLALGAKVVLHHKHTHDERILPLEDLYLGYKILDKKDKELVRELQFPAVLSEELVSFEKVSKRRWLDIATVNSAARLRVNDAGLVEFARLTLGGVAPTPLLLKQASSCLLGHVLDSARVVECVEVAMAEIAPISDVRGSAEYKRLLAKQLLFVHFCKLYPNRVSAHELMGLCVQTQHVQTLQEEMS